MITWAFLLATGFCLVSIPGLYDASSTLAAHPAPYAGRSQALHCPALPPPTGGIVEVDNEGELLEAVNSAAPDTTILIAGGTYNLAAQGYYLWIDTPGLTLRSASGDREAVILDDNYLGSETITIAASNVTIADLTIRRARTHPIHVVSTDAGDTLNSLIYNVHIVDPGQQAIKINPHAARTHFPDGGEIACSHLELTDAGRAKVWEFNGSCYTGGVDAHQSRGWTIRDNLITGFWCPQGLSEHGIHLWAGSRDPLIERNTLIDNARGVGLGLYEDGSGRTYVDDPCPDASGYVDHYGGVVRNNFISASRQELFDSDSGFDCGICLAQACNASLLHNTVASSSAPFSSIEWRFANTSAEITNNLVTHNLRERDEATASLAGNLQAAPLSWFADLAAGDLHLNPGALQAIDQGVPLAAGLCDEDIDGDSRSTGSAPDIGADEAEAPLPILISDLDITSLVTGQDVLTVTLSWTPPEGADRLSLHVHEGPLSKNNWDTSHSVDENIPGSASIYTATVSYTGQTVFFALRWQDASGTWSLPSNNVFWLEVVLYLPLVER